MSKKIVDYIIIGQGICGTFLSWDLIKAGKSVLVIDESSPFSASKVASGVINPVTGRRIVRTWEIETLMPYAVQAYAEIGNELGLNLIRQCNILDFHSTPQMKLAFNERLPNEKTYLKLPENANQWNEYFNPSFGIGEINPCWLIDIQAILDGWRKKLIEQDVLLNIHFNLSDASILEDKIIYQDYTAKKIIFCDGTTGFKNPYFHLLPFAPNKGEALIASIPDLPSTHIYKQGISIVPWRDGLYWIGSSYEWNFTDSNPSTAFKNKTEQQLKQWLKLPYTIVDHLASVRPANMERRPFIGFHPIHSTVGIMNGMGSKGCSLAPFFANQFTENILNANSLDPLVDLNRFRKILSR